MFIIFRDTIFVPFAFIGFALLLFSYLAFIVYSIVTPAYLLDSFFTNPSAFVALKFLPLFLISSSVVLLLIAAALYAYIEVGRYKQQIAILTEKRKILEVRMPDNAPETLAHMEAFLEMISYGSGEGLWFPVWWKGMKRPLYSFEIVSRGGTVSFFINTREFGVDEFRSSIFAFYPKAQVLEVDDYVYDIEFNEETHSMFTFEWKFKDDAGMLPIKSYVEFQLEKRQNPGALSSANLPAQQPQPLVDPLAPLYDLSGSLRGDEQLWVQYVFRTQKYARQPESVADDPIHPAWWKKQKLPAEIQEALIQLEKDIRKSKEDDADPMPLTESQRRLQEIGPRLQEKQALEVGIRIIYIASKEGFSPSRIQTMASFYKLTSTSANSLIPDGTVLENIYNVPSLDPPRHEIKAEKELLLQLYRDRLFWFAPAIYRYQASDGRRWSKRLRNPSKRRVSMVMTTETFATICHFPTVHIKTPSVQRALFTAIEPPEDLPV